MAIKISEVTIVDGKEYILAKRISNEFRIQITEFKNGNWKPRTPKNSTSNYGKSRAYFFEFPNGDKLGIHGFIKSVALGAGIFLLDKSIVENTGYYKSSETRNAHFTKILPTECEEVLVITNFPSTIGKLADILAESITVKIISRFGVKIFTGGQESSDWGDETPPNQTPLNTTDSSKTQNPLNIPRTNEEKRYAYYKTLARPEQSKFRTMLLEEYNNACVITGCTTQAALEAAHIIPFSQDGADTLENGLLLRADLHLLFDKGFMAIDPNTGDPNTGIVHFRIADKRYDAYNQKSVDISKASPKNLKAHWKLFDKARSKK